MAAECTRLLSPYRGKTILDATRFYVEHLEAISSSVSVETLSTQYLQSKARAKLSQVHLTDIEWRLRRFRADFGNRAVRSLSPKEFADWLDELRLAPQSINNFRAVLRAMFGYAVEHGLCATNPLDAVEKVKLVDAPPAIFSPDALAALLSASPGVLLPPLAIGAFAGLRSAELMRLDWSEVRLPRGHIEVIAKKAKAARRRLVRIAPNLAEWLSPFAKATGKVWPTDFNHYYAAIRELCGAVGVKWQANGLRHSFASYHLAKHQNAAALSLELGHKSPDMLFAHYRELVTPEDAERYWNIRPVAAANVVQLAVA